jgi:hypothetical protein
MDGAYVRSVEVPGFARKRVEGHERLVVARPQGCLNSVTPQIGFTGQL